MLVFQLLLPHSRLTLLWGFGAEPHFPHSCGWEGPGGKWGGRGRRAPFRLLPPAGRPLAAASFSFSLLSAVPTPASHSSPEVPVTVGTHLSQQPGPLPNRALLPGPSEQAPVESSWGYQPCPAHLSRGGFQELSLFPSASQPSRSASLSHSPLVYLAFLFRFSHSYLTPW